MYDLALLTKIVATTSAIMVVHDCGALRIDDPVSKYVPAFSGGAKSRVTIRQLLEHRSGLPAGRDVWRTLGPTDALSQWPSFRACAPTLRTSPSCRYWTMRGAHSPMPARFRANRAIGRDY
jgi:CubicO group peptidase (beta-lactamase class C family)